MSTPGNPLFHTLIVSNSFSICMQLKIEQEATLRRLENERNRLARDLANAEEKGEDKEKGAKTHISTLVAIPLPDMSRMRGNSCYLLLVVGHIK